MCDTYQFSYLWSKRLYETQKCIEKPDRDRANDGHEWYI